MFADKAVDLCFFFLTTLERVTRSVMNTENFLFASEKSRKIS